MSRVPLQSSRPVPGSSEEKIQQHMELLAQENKERAKKIDALERENRDLRKSLFDSSMKISALGTDPVHTRITFDIDDIFRNNTTDDHDDLNSSSDNEGRRFSWKYELKGHKGPIYCVQYSPCGRFLASGSFDKTVRIWDALVQEEMKQLKCHENVVSDLSWASDSSKVISGSYDKSIAVNNVETEQCLWTATTPGFVQAVAFNPSDPEVCFAGTSRNTLHVLDTRQAAKQKSLVCKNNGKINTLYPYRGTVYVATGDSLGQIKTWDIRTGECVQCLGAELQSRKSISHLTVSRSQHGDEEGRYMAANSFDNVLRVYDRGIDPLSVKPRKIHSLVGHVVSNWPIRSSFFHGAEHETSAKVVAGERSTTDMSGETQQTITVEQSLLLASGSADGKIYIFDVGGPPGTARPLQQLSGHSGRVYMVHFHPTQPMLVSSSADGTIRIWAAKAQKAHRFR